MVGYPVGHSRSPAMHNAAYRALGLDWRYLKLPVRPERFEPLVRALPGTGYRGLNVTIPHKVAALELAAEPTPAARAIGAANTLTFGEEGIEADNTDAAGFLDALGESPRDVRALVLGAGGAGRAVAWALREAGAEVWVWNRTPERAATLARELGIRCVEGGRRAEPVELLVNATSVGLGPHPGGDAGEANSEQAASAEEERALEALGLSRTGPPPTVVDLVYGDVPTALSRWAERGGARVVDGIAVLVRQGARSFERFTGLQAPVEAMEAAARE